MFDSWVSAAPAVLAAIAVLFVPGFVLVRAAGGRTAMALGLAPLIGTSIVNVSAEVLNLVGVPWNLASFAPVALLCCAGTWLLRRLLNASHASISPVSNPKVTRAVVVALCVAAFLLIPQLLMIFGPAGNISQTTDNVFHLNTIRLMLDLGNGSVFTPSLLNGDGPGGFYPAAWHSTVALIAGSTGVGIPAAVNSVNLVIGALVWPAGAIFLTRQVFGNRTLTLVSVGVLSVCFAAFPFRLLDWGVLYPNYLSMALTMPLWGLALLLLKQTASEDSISTPMTWWLALTAIPAALLSQPNVVLALIALTLPLLVSRLWGLRKADTGIRIEHGTRKSVSLLYIGLIIGGIIVWTALRPIPLNNTETNPPYTSLARSIGEWLTGTDSGHLPAVGTLIFIILGIINLIRSRSNYWFLGSYGLMSLLFIAAAGLPSSSFRTFLTGGWYDDYNRITGLLVVTGLPLAAVGSTLAVDWIRKKLALCCAKSKPANVTALAVVVVLGGGLTVSQVVTVSPAALSAASNYNLDDGAPMMSADEYRLFQRLDALVPANASIAGNPWNGSAMAYWVSGRHLVFSHIFVPLTPDLKLVARGLRRADFDAPVCAAAARLNIKYVLGSSEPEFAHGNPRDGSFSGMNNMNSAYGFTKVAQEGSAALYKMPDCQQTP